MENKCCEACRGSVNSILISCSVCPCHQEKPQDERTVLCAGRWHYLSCDFPIVDQAVCSCPKNLKKSAHPENSWEVLYDKEIEKVEDMYYGKDNGYHSVEDYLKSSENKLFRGDIYLETFYELDPDKIKDFIKQTLTQEKQKLVVEIMEMLTEAMSNKLEIKKSDLSDVIEYLESIKK